MTTSPFVICAAVVEQPRDFDDWRDEEPTRPLLPPDDRLWRHPSEIGGAILSEREREVIVARRRWLASTPTRAGAGTAGIVGALLATGVVLVGTHLTSWLTRPAVSAGAHSGSLSGALEAATTTSMPMIVGQALGAEVASIEAAVVQVVVVSNRGIVKADGVVVSKKGYVVVPAASLTAAESVSVVRSDGEELIAKIVGSDPATGIAILHVDESSLPDLVMSRAQSLPIPSLMLVASWTNRVGVAVAPLRSAPGVASLGTGPALLEVYPASMRLADAPAGAVVLDSNARVVGMVVVHHGHRTLATPGWVIGRIEGMLASTGHVTHGWLGIEGAGTHHLVVERPTKPAVGANATHSLMTSEAKTVAGVRVVTVKANSAAAQAGLQRGDVIEAVNGQPVTSMGGLQAVLYLMAPATRVRLEVVRGGTQCELHARLAPAA